MQDNFHECERNNFAFLKHIILFYSVFNIIAATKVLILYFFPERAHRKIETTMRSIAT